MSTRETTTAPTDSRGAPEAGRDDPVTPFPLAADCVGRPLVRIADERIARAFNERQIEQAIRQRLDGPPVHIEFGNEPFLSRFGNWAYSVVDWFCWAVIILAPAVLVIAYIRAVLL